MAPNSIAQHRFTFPPFPPAPANTIIIPFKDYKENGIKIQENGYEGSEVDALGIPTVKIEKRHVGDFCKTNSDSAKHVMIAQEGTKSGVSSSGLSQPKTWVQDWEDLSTRRSGEFYNKNEHREDRLHQATRAFNAGRPWPKAHNLKYVREQWDQFQLYIGILSMMPIQKPVQEAKEEVGDDADDHNEEEAISEGLSKEDTDESNTQMEPWHDNPIDVQIQETDKLVCDESRDREVDPLDKFLNDPKQSLRVYLSSYMRKQGFHYEDRNLNLIPTLIRFYIKFLVQDGVFSVETESETIASFNQALTIADLALTELPLTSQITKRFPWHDTFNGGCSELFDINNLVVPTRTWGQKSQTLNVDGEPTGVSSTAAATTATTPAPEEPKPLELEEDCEIVTPIVEQSHNALETLVQEVHEPSSDSALLDSWDSDEGTLQPPMNDTGAWNTGTLEPDQANASAGWGAKDFDDLLDNPWGGTDVDTWDVPPAPTLFPILGPTALPLTHTSGVVEWSMRRIQSIVHPNADIDTNTTAAIPFLKSDFPSDGPSANAVEADLSSRLSKVVMEPWLDWENKSLDLDESGDTALPQIQASSRGRVVVYSKGEGISYECDSGVRSNAFALSNNGVPHDPLNHSITLLVEPESAQLLSVGMGLGATWVQIARRSDLRDEKEKEEIEDEAGVTVDNGEALGQDSGLRFWYLSSLLIVLPSYHTVSQ
ncbi:hypothetical protein GGU11DRAFT_742399 [Lentinula aff. detonsa]|uniref:Uncharacterized protein n=1 Tax=Lentinula aff. detonsa TaxID=2804958 RepID=A0AA38KYJ9_9AGAR|nr:hypothetical protein GGU10DRAFT_47967 [Lentinula aff. detonsa]KAJ3800598.1 hypothetical protein GGU11DRAFT_742399 [Lentinula aff. detonsa]